MNVFRKRHVVQDRNSFLFWQTSSSAAQMSNGDGCTGVMTKSLATIAECAILLTRGVPYQTLDLQCVMP
jgi:hypothetical protein